MPDQVDDGLNDEGVTFAMEFRGRRVGVEDVPARADPDTGEHFFSPDTVDRLREIIWSGHEPDRLLGTPVFRFAA